MLLLRNGQCCSYVERLWNAHSRAPSSSTTSFMVPVWCGSEIGKGTAAVTFLQHLRFSSNNLEASQQWNKMHRKSQGVIALELWCLHASVIGAGKFLRDFFLYLVPYICLAPWRRVFVNVIVTQLVKKTSAFRNRKLLMLFISVYNQLDAQNLFHNKFYFMPLHVSSTCVHHLEVKIALHRLWYHHTYRWLSRARDGHI